MKNDIMHALDGSTMNIKMKPETKEAIIALSIAGCVIVTFYLCISHISNVFGVFVAIFRALVPFIFGFIFAFLLMPLRNMAEKTITQHLNWSQKMTRTIAVVISIVTMLLILIGFFWLLIPQLASSISTFVGNLAAYIANSEKIIEQFIGPNTELLDAITELLMTGANQLTTWLTGASGGFSKIMDYVTTIVSQVINFLIGIIIALYILMDSEKFELQMKKLLYAILPKKVAKEFGSVCRLTADMFYKFISGKAIDSLIIGIICYVGCLLLNMPYAVLIAVVVGITNMIPVFGPFIGAIPCFTILVMINWVKAVEFLIFIVILQQCDGNIIGPYILGDAVGLPTLWVMFAIIVGGALFGIVGMFIGVPTFAVIYTLAKQWVHQRLQQKQLQFDKQESVS